MVLPQNLRDAQSYAHEIIGDMNAGTNRFIDWNFCLDKTGRPRHTAGGCNAGIIIDGGDYTTNAIYDYYDLFSHYILPGAKRIGLSRCGQLLTTLKGRSLRLAPEVLT